MHDTYIEKIVKCKPPKSAGIVKVLMIILCILSIVFILIPYVGVFLIAAVIVATVFVFKKYDYEYEYSFIGGELDVDKIIARSKRKRLGTFDFHRTELVAPVGSQEALRLEMGKYKTFSYVSNMEDATVYVAYTMNNNEMVRLFFEPSEEMLKEIEYICPRKVIM